MAAKKNPDGMRVWVGAYCSAGAHGKCAISRCDCPCHRPAVSAAETPAPRAARARKPRGPARIVNPAAYTPRRLDRKFTNETVPCPKCGAKAGKPCREPDGRETVVSHGARCSAARPKERG